MRNADGEQKRKGILRNAPADPDIDAGITADMRAMNPMQAINLCIEVTILTKMACRRGNEAFCLFFLKDRDLRKRGEEGKRKGGNMK